MVDIQNPFALGEPASDNNPMPVKISSTAGFVLGEPTQEVAPLPVRIVSGMWRGTWSMDELYSQNDVVFYNGSSYIARLDHLSGAGNAPGNTDYWELVAQAGAGGSSGFGTWRGPWASLTAYDVNDVVEDSGSSYIAIQTSTGQQPPNNLFWELVAQAGVDGQGVPTGGTTGQVLKKASNTDFDTEWADEAGGGITRNEAIALILSLS